MMRNLMVCWWILVELSGIAFCLSYVEKSVLDRLLTYYDEKVRPADKRNFFGAVVDPEASALHPVIVNVSVKLGRMSFRDSMLTIDLELIESWYDTRLQVLQNSEKVRPEFQVPDNARIWLANGGPVTNFHESAPGGCRARKVTLSDTARLECTCGLLIQTLCDKVRSKTNSLSFTDTYECGLQFEPEDTFDVNYFCGDACQDQLHSTEPRFAPDHYTFHSSIRIVQSNEDASILLTTPTPSTTRGPSRSNANKRRIHHHGKPASSKKKKSVSTQDEHEESINGDGESEEFVFGDRLILDISLSTSSATFYIINAILPAACMVLLAWITLFSQRKMIRATFQSTTFFALIVLWGNYTEAPAASTLDSWFLVCLVFICLTVLESLLLACVPWPRARTPPDKSRSNGSLTSINKVILVNNRTSIEYNDRQNHQPNGGLLVQVEQCGTRMRRCIDKERVHLCFAFIYPLAFVGVSLCFWLQDRM